MNLPNLPDRDPTQPMLGFNAQPAEQPVHTVPWTWAEISPEGEPSAAELPPESGMAALAAALAEARHALRHLLQEARDVRRSAANLWDFAGIVEVICAAQLGE